MEGHWLQEMVMTPNTTTTTTGAGGLMEERRSKPQKEQALHCPRCNSTNTKFCYYNNYSLTQPRYFCKTCRRYWTEGGSLRNVPVGGGSRKNKKPSSSSTSTSKKPSSDIDSRAHNPKLHEGNTQDLNLAFPNHSLNPDQYQFSNNFTNLEYATGFGFQELRPPSISFGGGANADGCTTTTAATTATGLFFPFDGFKQVGPSSSAASEFEQNRGQVGDAPPIFWNGVIGGGGPW